MLLALSCIPLTSNAEVEVTGAHAGLECDACHNASEQAQTLAAGESGAPGCSKCHAGMEHIFNHNMATREPEQEFCERSWNKADPEFFATNCMGCHVDNCLDCHGGDPHAIQRPDTEACLECHNGYFVGWDYMGRTPRDDHERYQRGPKAQEQHYLKMRPDVHAEAGMSCGECHGMESLSRGELSSRTCTDCHEPDPEVIEHGIEAHMQRMTCAACHAAWSAQEYGTFYIQTENSSNADYFPVRKPSENYRKSAYLKRHDRPVLGVNAAGLVSPIRPQFIAYFSHMRENKPVGEENRLLAAEWKAYTPHTIQRGGPMCDACHADARRFVLQPDEQRVYRPDLDGLQLNGFWNQSGQKVSNGRFYTREEFEHLRDPGSDYKRRYIQKWQQFLNPADASSPQ
jgi:hypothetical protein